MLSQFRITMMGAAVIAMAGAAFQGQAVGQECSACSASPAFGFPATSSCGRHGCGLGDGHLRASLEQAQARNALVGARNDAWPKPFNCYDRQAYANVWGSFINAGYERQCVLSSVHFDEETNELNAFGKTIVSGLVQNMPQARRTVFVHRGGDEDQAQRRLDSVRESLESMFGQASAAQVAFSSELPVRGSALRVENLQRLEFEAIPVPVIPIASGTTSVSAGIGGGGGQ